MIEDLEKAFDSFDDEYLRFERISDPPHRRPDIAAFIMLDNLSPSIANKDMVSDAEHDIIYLDIDVTVFANVASLDCIRDLCRCGVCYDSEGDCLYMNV